MKFSANAGQVIVLEINDCSLPKKVFVPIENAKERIRHIVDHKTAVKVLADIASGKTSKDCTQTWNRRYREYMEAIS